MVRVNVVDLCSINVLVLSLSNLEYLKTFCYCQCKISVEFRVLDNLLRLWHQIFADSFDTLMHVESCINKIRFSYFWYKLGTEKVHFHPPLGNMLENHLLSVGCPHIHHCQVYMSCFFLSHVCPLNLTLHDLLGVNILGLLLGYLDMIYIFLLSLYPRHQKICACLWACNLPYTCYLFIPARCFLL